MGKRLLRYSGEKINEALPELIGKSVNLVMTDNSVYFVKILKQKETKIKAMNQLNKNQQFKIGDIAEIIMDVEA